MATLLTFAAAFAFAPAASWQLTDKYSVRFTGTGDVGGIFKTMKGFDDPFLDNFNFEKYGGTPILGINSPVIKGHGISHALAFRTMIQLAANFISSGLTEAIKEQFRQQPQAE